MKRDKPVGADLLETARELFRSEILPQLPASQKLYGLMIANAMGVAAREQDGAPALESAGEDGLRRIYPDAPDDNFTALNRRFARDIRAGRFDGNRDAYDLLVDSARRRTAIANPRALARK